MDNKKTLILIDGHALAFREYYALERTGMKTSDGRDTWAVYGFFKAIFDLLKNNNIKPDCIAVAFDVERQTFRVEKYEQYKATRESMPYSLHSQLGAIIEGLKAFDIPIYTKKGYEADDVIGTITLKASLLGHKTYILTGDQDTFQLVDKKGLVKVLIPSKGELIEYDWNKVYEKLGVWPNQVVDYKGLRGDTSDNIPGIKGVGEKTAQKILSQYASIEDVYNNLDSVEDKSIRTKLTNGKDSAFLSKYLATIVRDVDIDFNFDDTKVILPDITNVVDYLKKMQFYSFIKNIDDILCNFDKNCEYTNAEDKSVKNSNQTQLGLFTAAIKETFKDKSYEKTFINNEKDLTELINKLDKQESVSFDFVYEYKNALDINILGCAFAIKNNEDIYAYYIPNEKNYLNELKVVFENEKIKKYTYNAKININILRNLGIELKNLSFDILLASYIKNPSGNSDISAQALDYINHITVKLPFETKKTKITDISQQSLSEYTMDNAFSIYLITEHWLNNLSVEELKLHNDIELPLTEVLSKMEYDGVTIDVDYMSELSESMSKKIKTLERKIFRLAGISFNLNSPKQVGEILYDKLGIELKKKRGGHNKVSTSIDVLEDLADEYEICKHLIEYRKYSKLKSTYTDALPLVVNLCDSKIHTSYNQVTTVTGRLSSSNPNLQNIPIRTDDGNKLRKAFISQNKNDYILSADYSQIELRLLAHVSDDKNLIEAFNSNVDVHSLTASKVFNVPLDEVTKEMRYKSKAVNFGIIYGQTKYGLAKALKIPPFVAEEFINKYFETYPKVKTYMQDIIKFAHKNKYVETIFGRRRYFSNEFTSPNHMLKEFAERAAINYPMQGSAADLIKIAMININNELEKNHFESKMVMQVHDELVFDVAKNELEDIKKLVKDKMENVMELKVPLIVDVSWGSSWFE